MLGISQRGLCLKFLKSTCCVYHGLLHCTEYNGVLLLVRHTSAESVVYYNNLLATAAHLWRMYCVV
jgi:hypothetical protein